jgi:hypothetical protein
MAERRTQFSKDQHMESFAAIILVTLKVTGNAGIVSKSMSLCKHLRNLLLIDEMLWIVVASLFSCEVCFDQQKAAFPHSSLVCCNIVIWLRILTMN